MDQNILLISAMTEKCRAVIRGSEHPDLGLDRALHPRHLLWMCDQVDKHASEGPATKLHRWIGFIQAALLANRMVDLDGLKSMFDEAKCNHLETPETVEDLTDHLDPNSGFEFDLGGEG